MPAIEINNLNVVFTKYDALENISLSIEEGTFVSIIGPNGAGKSTLLKVILGIIQPSTGTINIFGKKPAELPANELGYVPQIKTLDRSFPALPIELVATGIRTGWIGRFKDNEFEMSMKALEQVGASHLAKRSLNKLSGGELQRVYLARAIVRKPRLLILDEPATGIDVVGEKDIHKIIDDYKSTTNSTVLMVTHDWESAYHHADFVMCLNRSLVCYDKPDVSFSEENLRLTFGHMGHKHDMMFGGRR